MVKIFNLLEYIKNKSKILIIKITRYTKFSIKIYKKKFLSFGT